MKVSDNNQYCFLSYDTGTPAHLQYIKNTVGGYELFHFYGKNKSNQQLFLPCMLLKYQYHWNS